MKLYFVTGNRYKYEEALKSTRDSTLDVEQLVLRVEEIQANNIKEVSLAKAKTAYNLTGKPVVVSDVSLVVPSLNGFPGPYLKYVNDCLSPEHLIMLLEARDRTAYFLDVLVAVISTSQHVIVESRTPGHIAKEASTSPGTPVDRIFVPDGYARPLAALNDAQLHDVWGDDLWLKLASRLAEPLRD